MGVEAATFISDFDASLPTSTDLRSQGDDHIRLEKTVLKNTFPNASKAFYFPNTAAKTIDFAVVAADMNKTFLVDTTAGIVNMTLPVLVAGDAGWECFLIKTNNGTSPVLVKPPSGGVNSGQVSVSAARRCIPNIRISILWSGAAFTVSRAVMVPVGSAIELHVAALPVGYEWPNGQTLGSAITNYPEFYSINGNSGVTLDKRGRIGIPLDNLGGSAAGRLAGGVITGTTVGNTGGTDTVTLDRTMIPTGITSSNLGSIALSVTSSAGNIVFNNGGIASSNSGTGGTFGQFDTTSVTKGSTGSTGNITPGNAAVTSNNTGGLSHSNLQPAMMVAQVLIVE